MNTNKEDTHIGKFKVIYRPDVPGDYTVIEEHCNHSSYSNKLNLKSTDRWLDLGSHIGCFALDIARVVDYVHCIEAEYSNVKLSLRNISLNPYANVVIEHAAVVSEDYKDDTVTLYLTKKSHSNSLHPEMYNVVHGFIDTIQVPVVHVNKLIKEHNLNKIKLDIEGAEHNIVPLIDWSNIDEFIMEVHTQIIDIDIDKLFNFLTTQGFLVTNTTNDVPAPNLLFYGIRR